ncbi:lysozyme [Maritimibacter sp. DP1N21-5]|uniref:lysozyme n=1 Tax=Maritimibacter sp. DP1N21-5 TaxID=2836867 RepID=UPI001C46ADB5|nr:hypothetical protein [Maritimibacter sp. DP1N21-5]MBV7408771.1 hypothetical protein [Maritimibacter sp. DP1N21-5]
MSFAAGIGAALSGFAGAVEDKQERDLEKERLEARNAGVVTGDFTGNYGTPGAPGPQTPGQTINAGKYGEINIAGDGITTASNMLARYEGFSHTPYWDVNAYRGGYGSDTITRADGSVVPVVQGMHITREDADRDRQRRLRTEFAPSAIKAVGEDTWNRLTPGQQGALQSLAYNYGAGAWSGSLANVAAAVRSGDVAAAQSAIQALGSHNGGVNRDRRNSEAAIFGMVPAAQTQQPQQTNIVDFNRRAAYGPAMMMGTGAIPPQSS